MPVAVGIMWAEASGHMTKITFCWVECCWDVLLQPRNSDTCWAKPLYDINTSLCISCSSAVLELTVAAQFLHSPPFICMLHVMATTFTNES